MVEVDVLVEAGVTGAGVEGTEGVGFEGAGVEVAAELELEVELLD